MIQLDDTVVSSMAVAKQFPSDSNSAVNSMDFSQDGSVLCCSIDHELVKVYNAEQGTESGKLYSKKYGVDLITFTHSNLHILHASKHGANEAIRYLSLSEYSYLRYYDGHTGQVTSLAMSPTDETFMSASEDNTVKLWDLRSSSFYGTIDRHFKRMCATFDPAGIVLFVASSNGIISLYDRRYYEKQPFNAFRIEKAANYNWQSFEIERQGKYLLGRTESCAFLLDAFEGKIWEEFYHPSNSERLLCTNFSPDGEYITAGTSDCKVLGWKNRSRGKGEVLFTLGNHKKPVTAVKWNPRKATIATGDSQVKLWTPSS
jgi:WD40 repeat protein